MTYMSPASPAMGSVPLDYHDVTDITRLMTGWWPGAATGPWGGHLEDLCGLAYALDNEEPAVVEWDLMPSVVRFREAPVWHSDIASFGPSRVKEPGVLLAPVDAPAEVRQYPRLRARGVLTNTLEQAVRAAGIPNWWSDLVGTRRGSLARAWFQAHFVGDGVKVVGATKIIRLGDVDSRKTFSLVQVQLEPGLAWVCVELLAQLYVVRVFRPLTEGLLASLRGRARLWAEEAGMSVMDLARVLPATLVLACTANTLERACVGALRGAAGAWSVDVLGSLGKGVLKERDASAAPWRAALHSWLGRWAEPGAFQGRVRALTLPT